MTKEKIKSFINYTGNKYNLTQDINVLFDIYCKNQEDYIFYDVFCGGGTVGYNAKFKNVVFVDSNKHLIELHKYMHDNDTEKIIKNIEDTIKKYNLTNSNKLTYKYYSKKVVGNKNNGLKELNESGYYKLRGDYNKLKNKYSKKGISLLHVLTIYSFNNDIRHNNKGEFNLPCGKTDFNKITFDKIIKFKEKTKDKNYEFKCVDILNEGLIFEKNAVIYLDPPYLITDAVYNSTSNWNIEKEKKLYELLNQTDNFFVLSNMLSNETLNKELEKFIKKFKHSEVEKKYTASSYNKKNRYTQTKEILVWKS